MSILLLMDDDGPPFPRSLFASGEQGIWLDPSDFSTLFQDAAGTTPVTAVGQPVGKILDKSGRGNHATQTTAASRPTVEARVNLLLNSGLTGGGAAPTGWAQLLADGTSAPVTSIYGGADGAVAYLQTATSNRPALYTNATVSASTTYTYSILIESVSGSLVASACATINNPPSGVTITYPVCSANPSGAASGVLTTGVLEVRIAVAATAGTVQLRAGIGCSGAATGTLQFSRPQFEEGTSRTTFQRVNTATDYVDVGAPRYLSFDGTDDGMATPSINFTGTDKMTVWAGVRKLSDAAAGLVVELSAAIGTNNGAFSAFAPVSAAANAQYGSKGTTASFASPTGLTSPLTFVMCGQSNIAAPSVSARINGVVAASSTSSQGTGNYGNYPLYIGRRGGASLPFNGRIYQLIVRGAASNAGQIAATEAYVNAKTRAF